MAEIKTKEKSNGSNASSGSGIRQLDRAKLLREKTKEDIIRTKDGIVHVKAQAERLQEESDNETTYAQDRFTEGVQDTGQEAARRLQQGSRKAKDKAKEKIEERIENRIKQRQEDDLIKQKLEEPLNDVPDNMADHSGKTSAQGQERMRSDNNGRNYTAENSNYRYKSTAESSNRPRSYTAQNSNGRGNMTSERSHIKTRANAERSIKTRDSAVESSTRTGRTAAEGSKGSVKTMEHSVRTTGKGTEAGAKAAREGSASIKTADHSIKTMGHSLNTAQASSKTTIKTSEAAAKATEKGAELSAQAGKRAAIAAENSAKGVAKAAQAAGKAISSAVKAIGSAAKEGFSAIGGLIAGSGPMIILIFVLAAVAVLCTGDASHRDNSEIDTQTIIQEINEAWMEQIDSLTEPYDEANTTGTRASWQEIMALYAAKSTASSVDTWEQEHELKTIFWEMHSLTYTVELEIEPEQIPQLPVKIRMKEAGIEFFYFADGTLYPEETVTYQNEKKLEEILEEYKDREFKQIINIEIHHKSMEEMMDQYGFNDWQREQAEMLISEEFDSFWLNRIYNLNMNIASTGTQRAIVEACMSTPAAAAGYCATWVSNVYANAGISGIGGNADDMWAAYCQTSDMSKLQPGMIIAVNSTGYSGDGYLYGHVGIYVGDNTVMHSTGGAVVTNTLDDWIAIYDTYGTVKWGFPDGVSVADTSIVNVATSQLGNYGGRPYWTYTGYSSRVEWCACFVSWCAGQSGYIDNGLFINTASPPAQAAFFQNKGNWMDGSGTPSPGMVIFFDWYNADFADHCGIVEKVENGYVYTIEGNSEDAVRRGAWQLGDGQIMGYGWFVD